MKLQVETKISKILLDETTHEQLEQFVIREFAEALILYGDSTVKESLGIIRAGKKIEKAINDKREIPKLKPTEKAVPKKKIEKR